MLGRIFTGTSKILLYLAIILAAIHLLERAGFPTIVLVPVVLIFGFVWEGTHKSRQPTKG